MRAWIDSHVHLFSPEDAGWGAAALADGQPPLGLKAYRQAFAHAKPAGSVIVHFSKAPDAGHVIAALEEARAEGIPVRGIVAADPNEERLATWLEDPDVRGARLYALDKAPDLSASFWRWLFERMEAHGQHVVVFGKGAALYETIAALPENVCLVIDHLGMPDVSEGVNGAAFQALLNLVGRRNQRMPVYIKGPGYRTSLDPKVTAPFVRAWAEAIGPAGMLLGASDAPFFGPVPGKDGVLFHDVMNPSAITAYLDELVLTAGLDAEEALHFNAAQLYGFGNVSV